MSGRPAPKYLVGKVKLPINYLILINVKNVPVLVLLRFQVKINVKIRVKIGKN